jgi:hypothetical protein
MCDKIDKMRTQRNGTRIDREKKKALNGKVGFDRAFMTCLIKEGNLQGKPNYDLEHMRVKERKMKHKQVFPRRLSKNS